MPEAQPARLVLWDVDHTLVDSGGIGERVYERAFRTVTGRPMEQLAAMTGRTDRAIIAETLTLHGLDPTAGLLDDFYAALTAAAHELRDEMRARGRALPGAREAINALARVGSVQSVVTGNLPGIAEIKLAAVGLTRYLDLEIGGYGWDGDTRPPLIRAAIRRAEDKYGHQIAPERVVVIGDIPLDVAAARQVGAAMVAVASGGSSIQALWAAGATPVLPDLTDTDRLVRLVCDAG